MAPPERERARNEDRMTGRAQGPSPQVSQWELLDALYLAACQDAAAPFPYRDWLPGRSGTGSPGSRPARNTADRAPRDDGPDHPGDPDTPGAPDGSAPDGDGSNGGDRDLGGDGTTRATGSAGGRDASPNGHVPPDRSPEHDDDRGPDPGGAPADLPGPARAASPFDPGAEPFAAPAGGAWPVFPRQKGEGTGVWPAAPALPHRLALARSLRPLRLYRPRPDLLELDEDGTAERAAADGLWLPVCRTAEDRRLDLTLLVDTHPSLSIWQDTVRQLRELLEQTAAFRALRSAPLDLSARGAGRHGSRRPADSGGGPDTLVLVVTDGVAPAWRDGTAASRLHALARSSPVAVLSVLPQELWEFTLPTAVRAGLVVPRTAAPNRLIGIEHVSFSSAGFGEAPPAAPKGAVAVPVVELSPGSLDRWARLVASPGGRHRVAALLTGAGGDLGARSPAPEALPGPLPGRARETVRRFMAEASPMAFALARRLAAAPLNLPVMRLVQRTLPGAESWNLAEIMLFGLLRRTHPGDDVEDAQRVSFDFAEGIREELLGLGTRAETMGVLRQVAAHLGPRLASSVAGGDALVAWQADAADPPLDDRTRPFLRPLRTALGALSGPYQARANRLQQLLHPERSTPLPPDPPGRMTQGHRSTTVDAEVTHLRFDPVSPPGGSVSTASQSVSVTQQRGSSSTPRRIGANLPLRNRNFTGREELLTKLRQRLATGITTAVLPEALHGMGGVGKSQIAIEYVYRHGKDYELIWWIPSEQTNLIVQSLIELGEQMGLRAGADRSAVPAVLEALRVGNPYSNWLLVFDNAENPHEVRQFFPHDGPGRVMVTSRNSQWSTLASSLEVDVFTRTESVALIKRRSPQIPDEAANRLADALGDLPLAVEQAAVWLAETGMPAHQYLDLFETKCSELLEVAPPADYDLPVAAAWNVSLDRLRDDHPAALQLLQICAFFAPEPISRNFFEAVRGVGAPAELRAALDDPIKLSQAVREIGRYALARIDHRNSTIQVHRLVQRVLIEQMNTQERAAMRHYAHEILANADPRNPQRLEDWPRYSALLPHVRATRMVECEDPWARQLILNEAHFLHARSDFAEALNVAEEAVGLWRRTLGDDHEQVIAMDQVRALALRWQNRYDEAYELQSELVERCRRVLGERNEVTQRALSVMAILLRLRGDFYRARELDQRAYETTLQAFGPDDPGTLQAAHNYAVSLRLAADFEKALRLDEETYERRVEVLGEDHLQTLSSLYQVAIDLQELGRYHAAADHLTMLRGLSLERLGEEHDMSVRITRELSVTRRKLGDHHGALKLSSKALELLRGTSGEDSLETARAALNHATDLRQTGDLTAAAQLGRRTMEQCRELLGPDHPHVHATATNLAVTLRLLGSISEAHDLDHAAVDGLSGVLSSNHPRTLLARTNLASDYYAVGQFQEAFDMDTRLLEISTAERGEAHPATLAIKLNLSYDLKSLGETARAQEMHAEALASLRRVHGPEHQATLDAENFKRANCDIDLLSI
ncbi:FxSxx-COOH system tetratricopeptide repeat protein [Streptomyces sp. NPDC004609]|uniref:FxSxx-COOH system tetratricopeptide repeat protein n=1 Tax=Streptomyces sp. NPDC004609 TaxID=3364704 RepID=UPI0036AF1255